MSHYIKHTLCSSVCKPLGKCASWPVTNHIKSFQFFWWLVTASLSFRSGTDSSNILALPPCHPVIKLHDNLQTHILKRGPTKWKHSRETKAIALEVKVESSAIGITEKISDMGMLTVLWFWDSGYAAKQSLESTFLKMSVHNILEIISYIFIFGHNARLMGSY